jgi:hypothetical protein
MIATKDSRSAGTNIDSGGDGFRESFADLAMTDRQKTGGPLEGRPFSFEALGRYWAALRRVRMLMKVRCQKASFMYGSSVDGQPVQ